LLRRFRFFTEAEFHDDTADLSWHKGFPYKKDSPSSGLFRVEVYNADAGASGHGMAQRNGTGMFPREVVQKPPRGFCQAKGPPDLLP